MTGRKELYLERAQQCRSRPGLKYSFTDDGITRFGFASGDCEHKIRAAVLKAHPDASFIPSESHRPRSPLSSMSGRPRPATRTRPGSRSAASRSRHRQ